LQDATIFLEKKSEHQERAIKDMSECRDNLMEQLKLTKDKYETALKENAKLVKDLNMRPENPPPPPAPPPPPPGSLFRFLSWKTTEGRKTRSKSMSRIEGRKKPMNLNDDILDAIRNRKYSLKKVEAPKLGDIQLGVKPHFEVGMIDKELGNNQIVIRLLQRRIRMEYSDDDAEDERSIRSLKLETF
jgi:hypothetical protein